MTCDMLLHTEMALDTTVPDNLSEMVWVAETLAKDFKHVRVDLYLVDGKIYFGEMTFSSESGLARFVPEEFGLIVGEWLEL